MRKLLRIAWFAALPLLLASWLPSVSSAADADNNFAPSPAMADTVARFIDRFIDPANSPEQQAGFFADDAEYYDQGVVGKAHIEQEVRRYHSRWPQRRYRLERIDAIIPDPGSDEALVRYQVGFALAGHTKAVSGTAYYIALLTDLHGAPKIEKIEEVIVRRQAPP